MRTLVTILAGCAILILVLAGTNGCELTANETPPQETEAVKQEVLHTIPYEASGPLRVVTSVITLPSGASTGRHIHHGLEYGYVLNGAVELISDAQPIRYFLVRDSFITYRDQPHIVTNSAAASAAILAIWMVDADRPASQSLG
jgi:quercetin dioxygenase-like cupin family protein